MRLQVARALATAIMAVCIGLPAAQAAGRPARAVRIVIDGAAPEHPFPHF